MSYSEVINVSSQNWQAEVMQSKTPVLVDFWAQWCGPCKTIGPILDELASELSGKIKIAKVDVDSNQDLAQMLSVRSLPTLLVLKEGVVQEQMVGGTTKAKLNDKLTQYI